MNSKNNKKIDKNIYYLLHGTKAPIEEIQSTGKLKVSDAPFSHQFKGVYFTLVTKYNIDEESLMPGSKNYLLFSVELLKQNNYHFNITDTNGRLNEFNTYYPWNINDSVKRIKDEIKADTYKYINEVIFHDDIDMKYCCKIIKKPTFKTQKGAINFLFNGGIKKYLPRKQLKNKEKPDMTKIPFYCFHGIPLKNFAEDDKKSSLKWFRMLANVANISNYKKLKKQELLDEIVKKADYLYTHRNEQRLDIFRKYVDKIKYPKK